MAKDIKVYTKTGDDGTTGLVGGSRVKKYDARLEAYGTIDELNSVLGLIRGYDIPDDIKNLLIEIQNKLFNIGSRLASDERGDEFTVSLAIKEESIGCLEEAIDDFEQDLPALSSFILPGGDVVVGQCHVARTICRRAERRIVEFAEQDKVQVEIVKYVNRLSDFLFVLARKMASISDIQETPWKH